MKTSFDVIISGLGPTGATLAALLGQAGVSVAVFDRLPELYPLPRAIGLDHEAMRIIQQLGLADRMAACIGSYRPSEYLGMDGGLIKRLDTLPEPHPLGWAPNYVFDQPSFERELRARLAELPTVQVFLQAEVQAVAQAVAQDGAGAWADVLLPGDSAATRFTGQYLVACDGGSSPIRKRLGIELEDLDFDEHWLVVDAIVREDKLAELPQTQVQYCEAQRPCTFVVGVGHHRRWEIMLLDGDSLSPDFPEHELWPLLSRWIKPGEARLWRSAAYRFHGLVAKQWRQERIFLAGDAAHMTPPFMAQGMVSGLRDAHNLAWKLQRALQGPSSPSSPSWLDSYMQEREPHVRQIVLKSVELGRIICERDPDRARARDVRMREAQQGVIKTEFRQNMIPGLAHGLVSQGSALAGTLLPQPQVQASGFSGRLDDLTGCCTRLVVLGALPSAQREAYRLALEPLDGVLVELVDDAEPVAQASAGAVREVAPLIVPWLKAQGQTVVLVRPDHYIYGAADSHAQGLALLVAFTQGMG